MPAMLKSKKFWGIIASFLFLWLAFKKVDLNQIPTIISNLRFRYLILICISYGFEHITRAIRWRMILFNRPMSLKHAYSGVILGYFFNNLLPARAGEFLRAYYLKRKQIAPGSEAFGSVVFERFLDGIVLVTFIVVSLQKFNTTPLVRQAGISAIIFYTGILITILLLEFRRSLFDKISSFFLNLLPKALSERLHKMRNSFIDGLALISKPKVFFKALIMSFFTWGLSLFTLWLFLEMFSFGFGIMEATLLMSVIAVGSMIPSSPGMIGVYQFCCVLALNGILGVSASEAAAFGMVCHTFALSYVYIIGFIVLTIEGIKFSEFSNIPMQPETE